MKYYQDCKLTVDAPASAQLDEAAIRAALDEALPGIEVTFRRVFSADVLEAVSAFVPENHPVAGAEEEDLETKQWVKTGPRNILLAAGEVLMRFNDPT